MRSRFQGDEWPLVARVRRRNAAGVTVGAVALAVATAFVSAAPAQIREKQAEVERVLTEIRQLDSQVAKAAEAYNYATIRLGEVRTELARNTGRLQVARHNLRRSQEILARRLVDLYKAGDGASTLEIILGAESLNEVIDRIDTVNRVAAEDAQVFAEVRTFRRQVARRQRQLVRARAAQSALVRRRARERVEIEAQLAERQRLAQSIAEEIARLQEAERRRQAELARRAQARLLGQHRAQEQALSDVVVGAGAVDPEGVSVAPPARYGGVVGIAMRYLGTPYRWGGASPDTGFDCSGFILYVYAQIGVSLPHYAASQYGYGVPVAKDQLEPGDLVFFDGLGHNGIYIGGGQFIHSPHTGDVVKISSLADPWYAATWVGARRL